MKKPIIIGIAGCSGSGKTTIAERVVERVQGVKQGLTSIIVKMDSYYKDQSHLPFEERVKQNYDHPDAFEWTLLREHLTALSEARPINVPVYSFTEHTRKSETVLVEPADVIVFEGILALYDEQIRSLMQFKYFVDTPIDECVLRRIERDINERGRTLESVSKQWREQVRPMFKLFVEPTKDYANLTFKLSGDVENIEKILIAQILLNIK